MRPDTSRTEADAAHFAAIAGRDEDFGGGVGDQGVSPLDRVDAQLRAQQAEHVCPACGEREAVMPRNCRACGWQNYGWGVSE